MYILMYSIIYSIRSLCQNKF